MPRSVKRFVKSVSNVHRPDGQPNVLLFSMPRSGSTWLMELIWTQPGFKYCNQPLSLHNAQVRHELGINGWSQLYDERTMPRLEAYFDDICSGRLRFSNPNPMRGHYRPVTHRIVFKEIHGLADRIDWFRTRFDARVVYLVRHPIAVAISSEQFPLLNTFLTSSYRDHFTTEQIAYANRVAAEGSHVERGVLAWCLHNAVPLRQMTDDWAFVTYEQLVLDPEPVIDVLADALELPEPDRIAAALTVPSVNVKIKSTEQTRQLLADGDAARRPHLIEKWRERVDRFEASRAMGALETFGIDLYGAGDVLPAPWAWLPRASGTHGRGHQPTHGARG